MALKEAPTALGRYIAQGARSSTSILASNGRRSMSSEAAPAKDQSSDLQDLESNSSFVSAGKIAENASRYNPVERAQKRRAQLPRSRYQYKPPRYYRGPLHPHQPPPASDPASREFVPGPFAAPRLAQTWESTVASDIMTLAYLHKPPGTEKAEKADRLRSWDDSSPYMKNRPKRGPRGGDVLKLIEQDINWRNIPRIEEITIHSMPKGAEDDSAVLHVAGMMLQSITGVRPQVHTAKASSQSFGMKLGQAVSLTCTLRGDEAWQFLDKCVNLVFPRIKDWPGVKGSSGDSAGNIAWGFNPADAILFPEVEVNYDMYPANLIPGFHVLCKTTATSDRHARLLLSSLGVPFYGKYVD